MRNLRMELILRSCAFFLALLWSAGMIIAINLPSLEWLGLTCVGLSFFCSPIVAGILARQLNEHNPMGWAILILIAPALLLPILACRGYGGKVGDLIRQLKKAKHSEKPDDIIKSMDLSRKLTSINDFHYAKPLIYALKDDDPMIREEVCMALKNMQCPQLVDLLVVALSEENENIRVEAANLLGQNGDPRATAPLTELLKDPVPKVRETANLALAQLNRSIHASWKNLKAAPCVPGAGIITCAACGKQMKASIQLMNKEERRVAQCRVCPADRIFAICEDCADLDQILRTFCPSCGAQHMWEIRSMIPQ